MSARATFTCLVLSCASSSALAQPPAPAPAAPVPSSTPATSATAGATGNVDDGYCEYVEGTASATASTLYAPELFGQFGHIEQPAFAETPAAGSTNLRIIGGVRWSLTNIIAGSATTKLAHADCKRHNALAKLRLITGAMHGASGSAPLALAAARALGAKLRVYTDAQKEAEKILADVNADLDAKRTTAPDAVSTKLRVDELRANTAEIQSTLAGLPPEISASNTSLAELLEEYQRADAQVEKSSARLRTIRAYDVSVRGGVDQFLDGPNQQANYFAVLQVGVNLGALWTGSGNSRSARGRKQFAASEMAEVSATTAAGQQAAADQTTPDQIRAVLDVDNKRLQQVTVLVTDLDQQLQQLAQIPGDDSRRFRQTIWFDAIKAKAELAYLQAHVAALNQLLGGK